MWPTCLLILPGRQQIIIEWKLLKCTHIPRTDGEERHFAFHPALIRVQCLCFFDGRCDLVLVLHIREELQRFCKFGIINRDLRFALVQPVSPVAPYKSLQCPLYVKTCTEYVRFTVSIRIFCCLLIYLDKLFPRIRLVLVRERNAFFSKRVLL